MQKNTPIDKPFFKCDDKNCNFVGEASIDECPFCKAKELRPKMLHRREPLNIIITLASMGIPLLFLSFYNNNNFNFHTYFGICTGVILGEFVVRPFIKPFVLKCYKYIFKT